jgi:hypothetical protein
VRVGVTQILYRDSGTEASETPRVSGRAETAAISPGQRRVLVALCRPLLDTPEPGTVTPSNPELAESLAVSIEAVRSELETLFQIFEIPDLPQNRKRAELARRALVSGVVGMGDQAADP